MRGERDDRGRHAGPARLPVQGGDEDLVDLDDVDRQPRQVAQGVVPDAEVVDRGAHAEGPDLLDLARHVIEVGDRRGLRDLEVQPLRGDPGLPQELLDLTDEVRCGELLAPTPRPSGAVRYIRYIPDPGEGFKQACGNRLSSLCAKSLALQNQWSFHHGCLPLSRICSKVALFRVATS